MSDKTIDRIGDAALNLFTEKGYFSTSMKDIAKKVGISAPAIYAHYPSKKDIFLHVVDKCLDLYTKQLKCDIDQLREVYDEKEMFRFFKLRMQSFKENERLNKFLVVIAICPDQTIDESISNKLRDNSSVTNDHYEKMYTSLADRKIIRPIGVELFVRSLNRLISGIFFDAIASREQFCEETLKILWGHYWEGIREQ